ncbi:MAG: polysaccharide biosynthesis protein [Chloroflexi bacterium]|nr:polysaccharide biosynthesis protein [Chloroflexota bacterium]
MPSEKSRPHVRNRFVLVGDVALILIAVLGSFALRLDVSQLPYYFPAALMMCAVALAVKLPTYYFFGLYRRLWIYASTGELRLITFAVTTASVLTSGVMLLLITTGLLFPGMPRSALGIDWLLSLVLIGGSRFALRLLSEQAGGPDSKGKHALIIGAGDAGALVVRELQRSSLLNLTPIGFLDDAPAKQHHEIYGVRVIGKISDLPSILDNRQVDEVIIAIPSAPGRVVRLVTDVCRLKGVPSRTMPGIYELLGGKVNVSRLREVDITDLLRRDPVRVNDEQVGQALEGRRVLVTGAGGSIGRELCRQIARRNPSQLMLLGHGENSIFEILLELREDYPDLSLIPLIADIRDRERIASIFDAHQPQVVFHAAAHKHVPLMEANPTEAVTNNVIGTSHLVQIAAEHHIQRFVLISTDKAVQPSSVYGATKRMAEMLVLDAARGSGLPFTVVRFGNVLGSRGSIIPLFKSQIARGGPLTVTHPDMRRFFMTIPEAVYLVLQAASMGQGGETFVLNMGEPIRIVDLAEDLIRLSGLEPNRDIEIVFTGTRPGEKLTEELWDVGTPLQRTPHPDIFRLASSEPLGGSRLRTAVDTLQAASLHADIAALIRILGESVPGASIHEIQSQPVLDDSSLT